jgi:hypothetical protein
MPAHSNDSVWSATLVGVEERPTIDPSTSAYELVSTAPRTFFGAPSVRDLGALDAQVAFLGVPFDAGTPQPGNRTGQAAGPAAARLSSWEQFDYGPTPAAGALGWYDIETNCEHLVGVTMADGTTQPTSGVAKHRLDWHAVYVVAPKSTAARPRLPTSEETAGSFQVENDHPRAEWRLDERDRCV